MTHNTFRCRLCPAVMLSLSLLLGLGCPQALPAPTDLQPYVFSDDGGFDGNVDTAETGSEGSESGWGESGADEGLGAEAFDLPRQLKLEPADGRDASQHPSVAHDRR